MVAKFAAGPAHSRAHSLASSPLLLPLSPQPYPQPYVHNPLSPQPYPQPALLEPYIRGARPAAIPAAGYCSPYPKATTDGHLSQIGIFISSRWFLVSFPHKVLVTFYIYIYIHIFPQPSIKTI